MCNAWHKSNGLKIEGTYFFRNKVSLEGTPEWAWLYTVVLLFHSENIPV